jgi:AhpD family alkylhydroperoxidase
MPRLVEYEDMVPRAKAVVDGIAAARGIDPATINNVWKALARDPGVMEQFAAEMKAAFAPGKLDPLTKELIYLAISIANQCDYCIASHGTMARNKGMTDEMHEEFMRVVLAAQKGNKIAMAYRVPVDAAFEEK